LQGDVHHLKQVQPRCLRSTRRKVQASARKRYGRYRTLRCVLTDPETLQGGSSLKRPRGWERLDPFLTLPGVSTLHLAPDCSWNVAGANAFLCAKPPVVVIVLSRFVFGSPFADFLFCLCTYILYLWISLLCFSVDFYFPPCLPISRLSHVGDAHPL